MPALAYLEWSWEDRLCIGLERGMNDICGGQEGIYRYHAIGESGLGGEEPGDGTLSDSVLEILRQGHGADMTVLKGLGRIGRYQS
jgi:hypothetical protein